MTTFPDNELTKWLCAKMMTYDTDELLKLGPTKMKA